VHTIADAAYDDGVDAADMDQDPPAGDKLAKLGSFAALVATLAGGIADSTSVDDVAIGIANSAAATGQMDTYAANGITQYNFVPEEGADQVCLDAGDGGPYDVGGGDSYPPLHTNCGCTIEPVTDDTSSDNTDDGGNDQRMRRSDLDIDMARAFPALVRAITESERRRGPTTLGAHTRRWSEHRGSPVLPKAHHDSLHVALDHVQAILAQQDPQTQVAQSTDDPTADYPALHGPGSNTTADGTNGLGDGTGSTRSGKVLSSANEQLLKDAYAKLAAVHTNAHSGSSTGNDDGTGLSPGDSPIQAQDGTGSRAKRSADKYTDAQLQNLHKQGKALKSPKDGHILLPVADHEDIKNAVTTVGLVTHVSKAKARKHIIKGAKALGADYLIPDHWAADGTLKPGKRWKNREPFGRPLGIPFIEGAS